MTVRYIQQCLGFAYYYLKSVENVSSITKPLTRLTRKDVIFEWSEECVAGRVEM